LQGGGFIGSEANEEVRDITNQTILKDFTPFVRTPMERRKEQGSWEERMDEHRGEGGLLMLPEGTFLISKLLRDLRGDR